MTSDTQIISMAAGSAVMDFLYGLSLAGIALVMGFYASWHLALMTLGVFPAMGLVLVLPICWLLKLTRKYNDAMARSTHVATEATGSMRTVISHGAEELVDLLYGTSIGRLYGPSVCCWWPRKSHSTYRYGAQRAVMIRVSLQLALWVAVSLACLITWYAYDQILNGELTMGEVFTFIMYSMNIVR
jgi:ABC-type multidrug transport system fused ATPase/permease subunit